MSLLEGQTALVTGATGGIGRAIALQLAQYNVKLCLVGRSRQKLSEVRKCARKLTDTVVSSSSDITKERSVERLGNLVQREFSELHILIHSAGVISLDRIERASAKDFKRQIQVNLIGPYLLTKRLLPFLKKSKGYVVFVNSSIVNNPRPGTIQFAATQHALKGLADCLRAEVNDLGIRVLSVFPGRTATSRQKRLFQAEDRVYLPKRLLQVGDVAAVVAHALSLPASAEVTEIHLRPALKT
jgi:NADP-dependent 3-hydroxy acid dehydrogenase YdfG